MSNIPGLVGGFGGLKEQQSVLFAGHKFFDQLAVVELVAGQTVAEADLVLPSVDKGQADVIGLSLPGGVVITNYSVQVEGEVTLGAATGTIKIATAANVAGDTLKAETAAAVSNVASTVAVVNAQPLSTAAVQGTFGGSAITLKAYATDGADAASTMTAGSAGARILVRVAGYYPDAFPDAITFPEILPTYTDG